MLTCFLATALAVTPGQPVELEPDSVYSFRYRMMADSLGVITAGNRFTMCNASADGTGEWRQAAELVATPPADGPVRAAMTFGTWMLDGKWEVRDVEFVPLRVKYAKKDGLTLGHGERLIGNDYAYSFPFGERERGSSRPRAEFDCKFQGHFWWFEHPGQFVTYRHALDGRRFRSGRVVAGTSEWPGATGAVDVEVSSGDGDWMRIGTITNRSCVDVRLPASMFPAERINVRLSAKDAVNLQVGAYVFSGTVDGEPVRFVGATRYYERDTGKVDTQIAPSFIDDERFGEAVGETAAFGVWTASSCRKVMRWRRFPAKRTDGVVIRTAANEAEPVQLVVRAKRALADVKVAVKGLDWVRVDRVGYVEVRASKDFLGVPGSYPELLVPQDRGACAVKADENQPFWVCAKPPKGTKKGTYRGTLEVEADGVRTSVPLAVEVFGFELPDTMSCQTAFGFTVKNLEQRQGLAGKPGEVLRMADRCYRILGEHHISPYLPVWFCGYPFKWRNFEKGGDATKAEPEFDFSKWDEAMEKALSEYGFNTFMLPIPGMGFCDFSSRRDPEYMGYSSKQPEYEILLAKYLKALEAHLREKGWLDKAYAYSFDEPQPHDYDLVRNGYGLIAKHAPGIRRMLPLLAHDSFTAFRGAVNLWCPQIQYYDSPKAVPLKEAGEEFWWYICNNPKAPYVGEDIDHPSAELRTWLWLTWKERVKGILIWETFNWFDRPELFPDQNGEARFFHPAPGFPLVSLRMDHLRDGLEDYEYFRMLEGLDPKNPLLQVPETVAKTISDFNPDQSHLEAHRVRLAHAIEAAAERKTGR